MEMEMKIKCIKWNENVNQGYNEMKWDEWQIAWNEMWMENGLKWMEWDGHENINGHNAKLQIEIIWIYLGITSHEEAQIGKIINDIIYNWMIF